VPSIGTKLKPPAQNDLKPEIVILELKNRYICIFMSSMSSSVCITTSR